MIIRVAPPVTRRACAAGDARVRARVSRKTHALSASNSRTVVVVACGAVVALESQPKSRASVPTMRRLRMNE